VVIRLKKRKEKRIDRQIEEKSWEGWQLRRKPAGSPAAKETFQKDAIRH
jgi:hypothetical protein